MEKNRLRFLFLVVLVGNISGCATVRNPWGEIKEPAAKPAEIFGHYGAGCLKGADKLPDRGPGFLVMHAERVRSFGHPALIQFIKKLSQNLYREKLGTLLIGDLAQPRGGPLSSGHKSHQTGLDVDIWFDQLEDLGDEPPLPEEMKEISARSVLAVDTEGLNPQMWTPKKISILQEATQYAEVDRIFINPAIKRELCIKYQGKPWLRKLRPWWGHDDHFHVRLNCPTTEKECGSKEDPIPPGDGCDEKLNWWFSPEAKELNAKAPVEKKFELPELPLACHDLLSGD